MPVGTCGECAFGDSSLAPPDAATGQVALAASATWPDPTLRTLQSWRPKPPAPTCASRRAPSPTPRASTSGVPPRAACSTSARPPRCKKRVASYFASVNRDRKSEELVGRAASIEPIVVASASEALLLEQQLIKRHRPPLNARLRDDKSYPYIAVTLADEYPRVLFTRERHRAGVRYFGPYASAQKVRTTLETLNKIFPYRPCEGPAPGRRSGVPCLDYHIGRCAAPCVGLITREAYRAVIDDVIAFLEGARTRSSATSSGACSRPPSSTSSRRRRGRATG